MNKYIVSRYIGKVKYYWTGTKWTDIIKKVKIFKRKPNSHRYKNFEIEKIYDDNLIL